MRRTRRSGGRPPKKSSAERINSAKRAIQRRRGTRAARNAARTGAERMAIAEAAAVEAAHQQAIADAEAEAQRAADRAREAAERLESLRLSIPASALGVNPNASPFVSQIPRSKLSARAPSFVSRRAPVPNPINEMEEGLRRQERFAMSFL
jgi:hypothetical protein